jgi:septum formation protein
LRFILGSGSPRRLELLAQLRIVPDEITSPDIDETPLKGELARPYTARLAAAKARAIVAGEDDIILSADTTVALGRRLLGKPTGEAEAVAFLLLLSGRRHRVITAIAVRKGEQLWTREVETVVKVKRLSDVEISAYVRSGDWKGKAGGYAIQGPFAAFVPWLQGSYSGVMGLPLAETATLLQAAGYPLMGNW